MLNKGIFLMNLTECLRKECTGANRTLPDKPAALREIARLAKKSPLLDAISEDAVVQALEAREVLGSTGFSQGMALPHARIPGVSHFILGIMTIPTGVSFKSLDGGKTRFFIFMIAPEEQTDAHLALLSQAADVLLLDGVMDALAAETSDEALYLRFLTYVRPMAEKDT
ncbi:MAG TPA: PTS sugar transporter subunit IIA [Candidatus Hydrogenedentes bacterium]|nr:PTS sugar transporter subunit IIA [Candidatus Hydrogenedentota bacterium]